MTLRIDYGGKIEYSKSVVLRFSSYYSSTGGHRNYRPVILSPHIVVTDDPTTYVNIKWLGDPYNLQTWIHITNATDTDYYFKIVDAGGNPTEYTLPSQEIGKIDKGTAVDVGYSFHRNAIASPGALTSESINLRLEIYEDSGYTTLVDTKDFVLSLQYINPDDSSWNVAYSTDFSDTSSFAFEKDVSYSGSSWSVSNAVGIDTNTCVSSPSSILADLSADISTAGGGGIKIEGRLYRTITFPEDKDYYVLTNYKFDLTKNSNINNLYVSGFYTYVNDSVTSADYFFASADYTGTWRSTATKVNIPTGDQLLKFGYTAIATYSASPYVYNRNIHIKFYLDDLWVGYL